MKHPYSFNVDPQEVLENDLACGKCNRPFVGGEMAWMVEDRTSTGQHGECLDCFKAPSPFEITNITLCEKDNLRALCSVKVADAIFLTGMRIIQGKNGLFVAMPARKISTGEYMDIYFAASRKMRNELTKLVVEAYEAEKAKATPSTKEAA